MLVQIGKQLSKVYRANANAVDEIEIAKYFNLNYLIIIVIYILHSRRLKKRYLSRANDLVKV